MNKKIVWGIVLGLAVGTAVFGGGKKEEAVTPAAPAVEKQPVTILVAAAASLKNTFDNDLIPAFRSQYPWITVEATYASSGALQTQIQQGLEADVFMSAATTQMNTLSGAGLIDKESVKNLLQNRLVLIKPAGSVTQVTSFETITKAKIIAIGDPKSVPAGQYAEEALKKLGLWDKLPTVSLGSNVTEVLGWVAEASAEAGIVYATDAVSTNKVEIIAELADGVLSAPVIYPVGIIATSAHKEEAALFTSFLQTPAGLSIFKKYGFSENQ
jgi:molybdate transport system substrate-binding protein